MTRRRTVIMLLAAVIAAAIAVVWLTQYQGSSAPPRPEAATPAPAAPPALSPNEGKGVLEPPR